MAVTAGTTVCPQCTTRVHPFAIDTNCTFLMCSNTRCPWPFTSSSMHTHFVHDTSRSSIRKRTKRRKRDGVKPKPPKQIDCTEPASSLAGDIEWLAQLCEGSGLAWMDDAGVPQGSRQPSPSSDVDGLPDLSVLLKPGEVDPMAALLSPPVSAHELNLLDPQFWSVPKSGFDLDELFKPPNPIFVSEDKPLDANSEKLWR
ncbi:hypothetical protein IW148_002523 [Coemansia sp. RSA 1199]|nr:hypothetical protein IW148_002523 [Coemansia sp. RSA 1199]